MGVIDGSIAVSERLWAQAAVTDSPLMPNSSAAKSLPVIHTPTMLIHYQIGSTDPSTLSRVELWYGRGMEGAWLLYDYDPDRTSPIRFVSPGEGIYRFLVVAVDRWGRRSIEGIEQSSLTGPAALPANIPAQMTVFIDYTSPRLYLISPRGVIDHYTDRHLQIRWEGFDQNLSAGPVTLYYRGSNDKSWTAIAQSQAARGEYSWMLPERLEGPIVVKAVLTDQAGNTDVQTSDQITVVRSSLRQGGQDAYTAAPGQPTAGSPDPVSAPITEAAATAFRRGNLHRERLEWEEATEAYRQAVEASPDFFAARMNLANTLYEMGQYEEALKHFELCLEQKPNHPNAMFNLAKTQVAMKQYAKADQLLDRLTQQDPGDYWAWLMRGDVAQQLGEGELAMNSWQRAAKSGSTVVRQTALDRLNSYQP